MDKILIIQYLARAIEEVAQSQLTRNKDASARHMTRARMWVHTADRLAVAELAQQEGDDEPNNDDSL
jgi:hypothetical protein